MKNHYEIEDDHAIVFLKVRDDDPMQLLVSLEDLPRMQEFPGTWQQHYDEGRDVYACRGYYNGNGRGDRKRWMAHRWILKGLPRYKQVIALNGDYLDIRRENLKVGTRSEYWEYKLGEVPGLSKNGNLWRGRVQFHGETFDFGSFETKEQAERVVTEARRMLAAFQRQVG